ncbi:transposase, partial [Pararhodobacter sp. SW119]|uniref:transposase n=1 Tax=Pararhodobacter sp. SW119 TaxID=2780075 RepID=UPI001ADF9349
GLLSRDHVHLLVSIPPKRSVSAVVQRMKGARRVSFSAILRPSARPRPQRCIEQLPARRGRGAPFRPTAAPPHTLRRFSAHILRDEIFLGTRIS